MTIIGGVGSSQTASGASGGKVYAYNALTEALLPIAAPANPARRKITFHNPSSVDVFVYPQYVLNTSGQNTPLTPTSLNLGGCFRVYANGGNYTIDGECQGQWGAFANDNSGNACLTVIDTNV